MGADGSTSSCVVEHCPRVCPCRAWPHCHLKPFNSSLSWPVPQIRPGSALCRPGRPAAAAACSSEACALSKMRQQSGERGAGSGEHARVSGVLRYGEVHRLASWRQRRTNSNEQLVDVGGRLGTRLHEEDAVVASIRLRLLRWRPEVAPAVSETTQTERGIGHTPSRPAAAIMQGAGRHSRGRPTHLWLHFALRVQIRLVACKRDDDVRVALSLQLLHPLLGALERVLRSCKHQGWVRRRSLEDTRRSRH